MFRGLIEKIGRSLVLAVMVVMASPMAASSQTLNDLFNGDVLQEIRLDINPKDWETLKANPGSNDYYPCNFRWRGFELEGVGIRQRGGSTRNRVKPGLRVDFNRYEANQEFLGLKSLGLDNMAQDASMMKERVAMAVYSKLGLPAAREVNARLYVNDQYVGLYAVIEPVDKAFLKRVFGENDGYLYEYVSPTNYHFEYLGADPALYSPRFFDPKTHEQDPNPAPIEAMIRTMNSASDAEFAAAMAAYLDLPAFMKHLAVEDFLAETDGILAGMNNFYLYRFEKKTLSQFITKDKDLSFGGPPVNANRPQTPLLGNAGKNVLIRRAMNVPQARDAYLQTLQSAVQLAGSGGWLEAEIARTYNQIRDAAHEDSNKQCYDGTSVNACTDANFEAEAAADLEFARRRGTYIVGKLAEVAAGRLFAVGDQGGMAMTIARNSSVISTGYAVITADTISAAPDGVAIFAYRSNGTVVTETSIPASAAIQHGLVYSEMNGAVKTGIAIANPGEQAAAVSFFYTDADGKAFGQGTFAIPAGRQIARFLDEAPFNSSPFVRATLSFDSSSPVVVAALRGLTNERSEFILSTLPVIEAAPAPGTMVIPHFASGGGWTTQIVLVNPSSQQMQGAVQFIDQTTRVAANSFPYTIAARSHTLFQTSGSGGTIQSGSVRIIPSGNGNAPAAFGVFSFRKDGFTVSEASVRAAPAAAAYRMYVELSGGIQTGIAIANPSPQSITVNLEATTFSGAKTGLTGTLTIPGDGQIAAFLGQILGFERMTAPFQGILRISTAAASGIAVAGLRGRTNERGDFLIAAVPSVDETAGVSARELAFPHFADGGGYTTQFIIFSGRTNAAPTGAIRLFDPSGNPINAW